MPSKIKSNAIAAGSAGFLKPTFSSLNKAVDKNGNRIPNFLGTKDEIANENKKQTLPKVVERTKNVTDPIVLPAVVKESPLHSSTSVTDTCHSNSSSKPVHPDVAVENQKNTEEACNNLVQALSSSLNFDEPVNNANDTKIRDARKVCDELREQIDHLKKQQQMFVTRLSGEFNEMENLDKSKTDFIKKANGIIDDPSILCQNCDQNDDGDGNAFGEGHGTEPDFGKNTVPVPIVLGTRSHKPILMKKVDYKSPSLSSEDGFNLHGSMMSDVTDSMMSDVTDFFVKDEWVSSRGLPKDVPPAKVIKRLMSERERYKKKVKHLQQALHKLKKQSQMGSFGRTPDIAAHDIVYFNADLIGEGYLSYVYSGTIYKNQKAAIKKLIRPDMMSTSDRSYLAAEAGLLMALHHQNIVEVFGVSTAPLQPLVITELVKGRNLSDRLHSSDGWPLSPVEYYSIVRDITVGMAYLHGQKPPVLHLNLRPCNVLLESNGRAKVADFGFSKIRLDAGMSNRANISYLAPELLQFPVHLTTKLDVYSYAMILWEMSTMTTPYKDTSISEILASVSSGKRMNIPCELPSGFHAVISRSWDQSPMQRPSFKELIIVLETMTLPQDWDDAIERSGLNRTDTRGLVTPRDDSNQDKSKISVGYFMPTTNKNKDAPQYSHPIPNGDQKVSQVENNINKERKKLSDELALESDMMTLGYNLPKPDQPHRTESSDYLRGFKRSEPIPHYNYHPASPQQKHTSNRRSLSAQLSPYKYNMINGSPVITHFHHRSRKNGNHERTPDSRRITYSGEEIHPHFKAARNLDQELSLHYDVRSPSKLNGHAPTYSPSENRRSKPNYYGEKYKKSNGRHERPKYGILKFD